VRPTAQLRFVDARGAVHAALEEPPLELLEQIWGSRNIQPAIEYDGRLWTFSHVEPGETDDPSARWWVFEEYAEP
jgi:hypothetical protein